MPDQIERTIYKLDLDDSGYTRGVDRVVNNTQRFAAAQDEANKKLQQSKQSLKEVTDNIVSTKQQLDALGTKNAGLSGDLTKRLEEQKRQQVELTDEVKKNQKAYEDATLAAQKFAATPPPQPPLPTPATGPVSGGILPSGSAGATLQALVEQVRNSDFSDINNLLDIAADDFEKFREATAAAAEELEVLEHTEGTTAEETRVLSESVHEANLIIDEYDAITNKAGATTLSYRTQISNLTRELSVLTEEGKEGTQEFLEKEKALIRVTRAYKDQRETIRILSSETRTLDFGRAAITTATTAFQGFTAVQILAGGASEELQRKTFQLFAVMQLITSIEQLHNQLKAVSVLRTNAQSAATAVYTAAVGASTGALKALRLALLGTVGVGVLVGIGLLIARYVALKKATEEARESQEQLKEVNEEAIKSFTAEVVHLNLIKTKLNDLSIAQKERIKLAKEYNKTAEEGNKIDLTQINNIDLVNSAIDRQIAKIEQRARARAAENVIIKAQEDVFIEEENARIRAENLIAQQEEAAKVSPELKAPEVGPAVRLDIDIASGKIVARAATQQEKIADRVNALIASDPKLKASREKLERSLKNLSPFISIDTLLTPNLGDDKKIDNVFEAERQRLLDRLRQLRIDEETGIRKINDEFAFKFEQEQRRIAKLLKDKKITAVQAVELLELSVKINKAELDKALDDFNKTVIDKREKLNEQLRAIELKNTEDEINRIKDEFSRRAALIDFSEQRELEQVKKATADRLKELESIDTTAALGVNITPIGGATPDQIEQNKALREKELEAHRFFQEEKNRITEDGEREQTNIVLRAAQERSELAQEIFLRSLNAFDQAISDQKLINDKAQLEEIRKLVDSFSIGAITYEDYRKKLSAIQDKYDRIQLVKQVDTLQQELRVLRRELNNELDTTSKHYDDLIKLIKQKEQELVTAQKSLETSGVGGDTTADKKVETIQEYAEAIGKVMEAVVAFWKTTNEAEAAALDRSIALQERRVTEAQRIAERGNASYLRMEEDRLKELQIAKENAARKQLAIDAALQASQLLVGITGAIADLAKGPGGIARTIADIAVIVGALASGYALVRSLQANQLRLATGTEYVKRKDEPAGVDTIPAWLTEGEAVIPQEKNRKYKKSVQAIYHGRIPADVLNNFVENYVTNNTTNKTDKKETSVYKNFVQNISKVPAKVLNNFIENYNEDHKYFRGSTYVTNKQTTPIFERVVPATYTNKQIERFNNRITDKNFVSKHSEKYHTLKTVPQVNYQKVKDTAAMHISIDGKLAMIMTDQNRKIDENNDLQRQTLNAMKHMSISAKMDKDGIAIAVNEYIEKMKIDKKI